MCCVQGHETCLNNAGKTSQHASGGWTLVDVSNPKSHRYLVRGFGDFANTDGSVSAVPHESHSQFMWDAGDHAYLVVASTTSRRPTSTSSTSATRGRR